MVGGKRCLGQGRTSGRSGSSWRSRMSRDEIRDHLDVRGRMGHVRQVSGSRECPVLRVRQNRSELLQNRCEHRWALIPAGQQRGSIETTKGFRIERQLLRITGLVQKRRRVLDRPTAEIIGKSLPATWLESDSHELLCRLRVVAGPDLLHQLGNCRHDLVQKPCRRGVVRQQGEQRWLVRHQPAPRVRDARPPA